MKEIWQARSEDIDRLLFMKSVIGEQIDLEMNSIFYWLPIKGTQQWNPSAIYEGGKVCKWPYPGLKFQAVYVTDRTSKSWLSVPKCCFFREALNPGRYGSKSWNNPPGKRLTVRVRSSEPNEVLC